MQPLLLEPIAPSKVSWVSFFEKLSLGDGVCCLVELLFRVLVVLDKI